MSEEKPTFKVTDRRLFNSDGSPRADIAREEERPAAATTAPPPPAPEPTAAEQRTAEPVAEASPLTGDVAAPPGVEEPSRRAAAADDEAQQPERGATTPAERESADPTPFANLVMFIASPAAAAMGMTEHPGLAPGEVDLPLAKHCIDLLAIVREKSRGNLSQQEQQIVDGLLAELRMQYVSLTSAPRPPAAPRGFTGGDITGGR